MNPRALSPKARFWAGVAITVVAILMWKAGTFDKPLSTVGLNAKTCIVVVTGNKLCGNDAKAWCNATDGLRREARIAGYVTQAERAAQNTCDEIRQ